MDLQSHQAKATQSTETTDPQSIHIHYPHIMNPQFAPIIHIQYPQNMDTPPPPIINIHYPQNTTTPTPCPTCGSQIQEGDTDEDGGSENSDAETEDVSLLYFLVSLATLPILAGILILVLKFLLSY